MLNHPVKNSLNFRHPSGGGEFYIFSGDCIQGSILFIHRNSRKDPAIIKNIYKSIVLLYCVFLPANLFSFMLMENMMYLFRMRSSRSSK